MRRLAATTLAALALCGPVVADTAPSDACTAQAEATALTGAKGGYAARYTAAYSACMGQGGHASLYRQPPRRPQHNIIARNCPPGASVMYGGTTYCPQG